MLTYFETDPNNDASGVFIRHDPDKLVVTWHQIISRRSQERYTFQIVLYASGSFEITHLEGIVTANTVYDSSDMSWIVGVIQGGIHPDVEYVDLNSADGYIGIGARSILDNLYIDVRDCLHQIYLPLVYLIFAGTSVVMIGSPIFFHFNLVKPLNTLLQGVKQVNDGNLQVHMPIRYYDEVGFLTASFNRMVLELNALVTDLEARVSRRTHQLEQKTLELEAAYAQVCRQEEILRESEARYKLLTEMLSDCVLVHTVSSNGALETEWIIGHQCFAAYDWSNIHPDDVELVKQSVQATLANQKNTTEWRLKKADGEYRWVSNTCQPVWDEAEGRVVRYYSVIQDITDRKQVEQSRLEISLEKARLSLLRQFITQASHEFRTPLAIINTSAFLAARVSEPEQRQAKVEMISAQVGQIAKLVDMMLKISRLESGDEITLTPLNIIPLLKIVLQAVAERYGHRPALIYNGPPSAPPVCGNQDDLQEALAQILDNAYRFTPPDGTIEVSVMVENPSINIVVSDTGPGIATEHLPHIFETFWRLDEAHSTPGLGLGLSLARKIIEMHGGSIAVDSVVGEGTTFVLRLPITEY